MMMMVVMVMPIKGEDIMVMMVMMTIIMMMAVMMMVVSRQRQIRFRRLRRQTGAPAFIDRAEDREGVWKRLQQIVERSSRQRRRRGGRGFSTHRAEQRHCRQCAA